MQDQGIPGFWGASVKVSKSFEKVLVYRGNRLGFGCSGLPALLESPEDPKPQALKPNIIIVIGALLEVYRV